MGVCHVFYLTCILSSGKLWWLFPLVYVQIFCEGIMQEVPARTSREGEWVYHCETPKCHLERPTIEAVVH